MVIIPLCIRWYAFVRNFFISDRDIVEVTFSRSFVLHSSLSRLQPDKTLVYGMAELQTLRGNYRISYLSTQHLLASLLHSEIKIEFETNNIKFFVCSTLSDQSIDVWLKGIPETFLLHNINISKHNSNGEWQDQCPKFDSLQSLYSVSHSVFSFVTFLCQQLTFSCSAAKKV